MKKLFTLAIGALCGLSAMAGDWGFCNPEGVIYADGVTVQAGYEAKDLVPGIVTLYESDSQVFVTGVKGTNYTLEAVVPTEYKDQWAKVSICGFGICKTMDGINGFFSDATDFGDQPIDIQCHYKSQNAVPSQECFVNCTMYETANPSVKRTITIQFLPKPASEVGGIGSVGVDNNAPVEYFNILGQKVANPAKGQVLIRRQGATATKVLIK